MGQGKIGRARLLPSRIYRQILRSAGWERQQMENSDWRMVFVQHRHRSEAEISLLPTETGRERERCLFTKVWAM